MDFAALGISLMLPWVLGVVWLRYRWQAAPDGAWAVLLGYGYLLGILAVTMVMRLWQTLGLRQDFVMISLFLGGLVLLGAAAGRATPLRGWGGGFVTARWRAQGPGEKAVFLLLLALILVRFASIAPEILWRPLYAWDAWMNWAPKARVWFALGHLVPFGSAADWLSDTSGRLYTFGSSRYPDTVPLIETWTALGLGRWNDSIIGLAWLQCALALGLAFYGQARLWGVSPLSAMVFTYLLLSLPFLNTHVALAGYADLWMAAIYGAASLAFFHWVRSRDLRQGLLALAFAVACADIKLPGVFWTATLIPALVVAVAPRAGLVLVAAVVVLGIALGAGSGITGILAGWLGYPPPRLEFHPLIEPFLRNWLVLDNWHLYWYLVFGVMLLAHRTMFASYVTRAMTMLVVSSLGFVTLVFFFTDKYAFAADYTTLNRVLLHVVPMLTFYSMVVLQSRLSHEPSQVV